MNYDKYKNIQLHYESCLDKYGENHLGLDWPNHNDMILRYKIMLNITKFFKPDKFSILDFGAGISGLYQFIKEHDYNLEYSALDISYKFCEVIKKKYPEITVYHKDILRDDLNTNFDFVILNGVFTIKKNMTENEMFDFFKNILIKIWKNTNHGISFNIMTPIVDYKDDNLFYLSFDKLGKFLKENLSKNYIINHHYNLWEYTVYVFK